VFLIRKSSTHLGILQRATIRTVRRGNPTKARSGASFAIPSPSTPRVAQARRARVVPDQDTMFKGASDNCGRDFVCSLPPCLCSFPGISAIRSYRSSQQLPVQNRKALAREIFGILFQHGYKTTWGAIAKHQSQMRSSVSSRADIQVFLVPIRRIGDSLERLRPKCADIFDHDCSGANLIHQPYHCREEISFVLPPSCFPQLRKGTRKAAGYDVYAFEFAAVEIVEVS